MTIPPNPHSEQVEARGTVIYGIGIGLFIATWLSLVSPVAPLAVAIPTILFGMYRMAVTDSLPRRARPQEEAR